LLKCWLKIQHFRDPIFIPKLPGRRALFRHKHFHMPSVAYADQASSANIFGNTGFTDIDRYCLVPITETPILSVRVKVGTSNLQMCGYRLRLKCLNFLFFQLIATNGYRVRIGLRYCLAVLSAFGIKL
jgi:hypothetical protein